MGASWQAQCTSIYTSITHPSIVLKKHDPKQKYGRCTVHNKWSGWWIINSIVCPEAHLMAMYICYMYTEIPSDKSSAPRQRERSAVYPSSGVAAVVHVNPRHREMYANLWKWCGVCKANSKIRDYHVLCTRGLRRYFAEYNRIYSNIAKRWWRRL